MRPHRPKPGMIPAITLRLRKSGEWAVVVTYRDRVYEAFRQCREEAEDWGRETAECLEHPERHRDALEFTPTRLVDVFDAINVEQWQHQRQRHNAASNGRMVVAMIGNPFVHQIGPREIAGLIKHLESNGYAESSINRKLESLSQMLRFALDRGWMVGRPMIERKLRKRATAVRMVATRER